MIGIIDYGAGNLFSVKNSLDYLKIDNLVSKDRDELARCERIILPGVGAFRSAMEQLSDTGLIDFIKEYVKTKPMLGICLGMQMLFDTSDEFGECDGLGLIDGKVSIIDTKERIPHMGWNKLQFNKESKLLDALQEKSVYFVHSFMAYTADENVVAYTDYECKVTAIVQKGNVYGCQFHPEKSGEYGLSILKNFSKL